MTLHHKKEGQVMIVFARLFLYYFFFFFSPSIFGYTFTQSDIYGFKKSPIKLHIETTNCNANTESLVEKAIDVWNGASQSSLKLEKGSNVSYSRSDVLNGSFSEDIIVYCSLDMQADTSRDPNFILGVGVSQDTIGDNHLDKGFLILNYTPGSDQDFNVISEEIKIFTTTHEIGHVLGLGHTSESSALMYYDAGRKENTALHQDDIDGIRHLYPQNELEGDYLLGCAQIENLNNKPPTSSPYNLAFLIGVILFLISQRKNRSV